VSRSHWTGSAVVCSRAQYASIRLLREEFSRPGVYVLVGPSSSPRVDSRIYVGEGDVLRERLDQHNKSKDFWTRLIAFTSSDGALNKALIKYIESRLAKQAAEAGRAELDNGNVPPQAVLNEADLADAATFLADMLVIYPLLGVDAFEKLPDAAVEPASTDLFVKSAKADARGREVADEFVVFRGSTLAPVSKSLIGSLVALREALASDGHLVEDRNGSMTLLRDRTFKSPSYAAAFVLGRAANGRTEWKNTDGLSLKELAERETA